MLTIVCWHFNIYEQKKNSCSAELSMIFYNLGADFLDFLNEAFFILMANLRFFNPPPPQKKKKQHKDWTGASLQPTNYSFCTPPSFFLLRKTCLRVEQILSVKIDLYRNILQIKTSKAISPTPSPQKLGKIQSLLRREMNVKMAKSLPNSS